MLLNIIESIHLLISIAILVVLVDCEYSFSKLSKVSKRRWKRYTKKFWRDTKSYFRRKSKVCSESGLIG